MATITLIAAAPFDDVPGVRLDRIDLPFLNVPPVQRWMGEYSDYDIYAAGHDGRIPISGRTLDIPVTDEEYREFFDAVARTR